MITTAILLFIMALADFVVSLLPTMPAALSSSVTSAFSFIFSFVSLVRQVDFLQTFFTISFLIMGVEIGWFVFHWSIRVYHLIRG